MDTMHNTVKSAWTDHCHQRPPVLKDQVFLAEGPKFQCNWTCHQRPHLYVQWVVFQDRFHCTVIDFTAWRTLLLSTHWPQSRTVTPASRQLTHAPSHEHDKTVTFEIINWSQPDYGQDNIYHSYGHVKWWPLMIYWQDKLALLMLLSYRRPLVRHLYHHDYWYTLCKNKKKISKWKINKIEGTFTMLGMLPWLQWDL